MASKCQVLIDECSKKEAQNIYNICATEAKRIESKYSRYRDDNIIYSINHSRNRLIELDKETLELLNFAGTCYQLSDGNFDISAGILRNIWRFDQLSSPPDQTEIENYQNKIGWNKISIDGNQLSIPSDMEVDLGGIGKEYAVDRCASLIAKESDISFALNFGGDVFVNRRRRNSRCWKIGIETPEFYNLSEQQTIELANGGIATSGNTKRFFEHNGKRYGHILNPKTAMPVENAPLSVTVIAENCTHAGMLATFAMLEGENAENFLKAQDVRFWTYRE